VLCQNISYSRLGISKAQEILEKNTTDMVVVLNFADGGQSPEHHSFTLDFLSKGGSLWNKELLFWIIDDTMQAQKTLDNPVTLPKM
jgi:hypothetical protein